MKRTTLGLLLTALLVAATLPFWYSCVDEMENKTFLTSDEEMMDDYIVNKDNSMSSFLEIADRAEFRGMIHAYGTYTFFVPTNEAIAAHLQGLGKSSVAELTQDECVRIIKYHVVKHPDGDTAFISSSSFVDGRFPLATMLAKYLTTKSIEQNGRPAIQVNRQAIIVQRDIHVGNGYIHKIDRVLEPPTATCGEQIQNLPDSYALFKEVMSRTGWITTLTEDKADGVWYSVFAQSDEAFAGAGIALHADSLASYLKEKIRLDLKQDTAVLSYIKNKSGLEVTEANVADALLWIFAAYHCIKGLYYVADLVNSSSLQTLAPNQAMTFKVDGGSLLVNEYINVVANQYEPGIPVRKASEYTDLSCYNGVILDVDGYVGPQKRGAQAVYWDVAEQPEFRKNSKFRKSSFPISWDEAQTLSEIRNITLTSGKSDLGGEKNFTYFFQSSYDDKWQLANQDALQINWTQISSMELVLPMLTPGIYNVWACFRRADLNTCRVRATFIEEGREEFEMGAIGLSTYLDIKTDAQILLGQGMKRYAAKKRNTTTPSLLWGTMEVKSTGRHKLRIDVVDKGRSETMWLDMIHFIPTEQDQLWPRFDMKGVAVDRGTECDKIYPTTGTCSDDNDVN
ncbi:MAG: fasciclin domain-containing protein [Prevotellaceae bacterium]|jgi:uncharacterized surface protein with fasciclin (FAS1) repeats|nr:fasciclin domain-containing protein [Prevotellaceae bacterium]